MVKKTVSIGIPVAEKYYRVLSVSIEPSGDVNHTFITRLFRGRIRSTGQSQRFVRRCEAQSYMSWISQGDINMYSRIVVEEAANE